MSQAIRKMIADNTDSDDGAVALDSEGRELLLNYLDALEDRVEALENLAQLRGEHVVARAQVLERLVRYARAIAGDIEYSGDHPIALAEKSLGGRQSMEYGTSREFTLQQVAELKVKFDLTGLEIGNAAALVRLPLGNKS